ncbi:MAG TPA: NAD(P)-binding domain-containing protein, partial [Herpetosiphonaceae bacterium]|nr:NAD(P)-binding domain-containing protein [Herpetosiphonaceae bacterium]
MNEHIAILGTGRMGRALAGRLARAGLAVAIGSRSPERAAALADELRASVPGASIAAGTYAEAAARSGASILALGFGDALALLPTLCGPLAGKLVLDPTTPWDEEIAEASAAERLAALMPPEARLVGAWKTTFAGTLDSSDPGGTVHDVLLCGADAAAKRQAAALIAATGMRAVDCGGLDQARTLEAMVRMMGAAARNLG